MRPGRGCGCWLRGERRILLWSNILASGSSVLGRVASPACILLLLLRGVALLVRRCLSTYCLAHATRLCTSRHSGMGRAAEGCVFLR